MGFTHFSDYNSLINKCAAGRCVSPVWIAIRGTMIGFRKRAANQGNLRGTATENATLPMGASPVGSVAWGLGTGPRQQRCSVADLKVFKNKI